MPIRPRRCTIGSNSSGAGRIRARENDMIKDNDPNPDPPKDPPKNPDPPKADPPQKPDTKFTQADLDAARETERKRVAKLESKIQELEDKHKTDDEKKADELKAAGKKEAEEAFSSKETVWGIERAILKRGLPEGADLDDLTAVVQSRMKRDGIDDPNAAVKSLAETSPNLFGGGKTKERRGPGGGGGRGSEQDEAWTDDAVNAAIKDGTYDKHKDEIEKARRSHVPKVIQGGLHNFTQKQ